jgi:hypothetical protein
MSKKDEHSEATAAHHKDRGILSDLGEAAAETLSAAGKVVEATGKGASDFGASADDALEKHEARKQQQT